MDELIDYIVFNDLTFELRLEYIEWAKQAINKYLNQDDFTLVLSNEAHLEDLLNKKIPEQSIITYGLCDIKYKLLILYPISLYLTFDKFKYLVLHEIAHAITNLDHCELFYEQLLLLIKEEDIPYNIVFSMEQTYPQWYQNISY